MTDAARAALARKGVNRVEDDLPEGAEVDAPVPLIRVLWGEALLERFTAEQETEGDPA